MTMAGCGTLVDIYPGVRVLRVDHGDMVAPGGDKCVPLGPFRKTARICRVTDSLRGMNRKVLVIFGGALALLLGTAGWASSAPGHDFIFSNDIAEGGVHSSDIKNGTIRGKDVKNNSLTAKDIDESTLDFAGKTGATGAKGDKGDTGAAGVSGHQRVESGAFSVPPGDTAFKWADCPTGKVGTGGGYSIQGFDSNNFPQVIKSGLSPQADRWIVGIRNPSAVIAVAGTVEVECVNAT